MATKKASTTRKSTAKKSAARKSTAKKAAGKASSGPSAAGKTTVGKAAGKKTTGKKATGKKAPAKKTPAKKTPTKKSTTKAPAAKKAPAKKTPTKKAPTKKSAATKAAPSPAVKKSGGKKAAVTKKTVTTVRTSIGSGIGAPPPKPPVTKKKKKTDRRVAPTVVPSRRKLQKKAEAEAAAKSPRRKIDFANPRSVAAAAASSEADADGYVFINGRRVRAISTKGATIKKKKRTVQAVEPEVQAPAARDVSKIKTKLSKTELTKFRDLLILRRREIVGMVSGLETEALRSSGGNLSNMPMHMADVGTDVFEQDFTLGMAAQERELIVQIDAALQRIEDRTYGVCQATGKPIPKARLNAKPWAKYTIEAARAIERGLPAE